MRVDRKNSCELWIQGPVYDIGGKSYLARVTCTPWYNSGYPGGVKTAVSMPDDLITDRLNELYSHRPAKVDPAFHRAQLKSIGKDSW
jgi:hypothetical protein